jgi:hypothetical protein
MQSMTQEFLRNIARLLTTVSALAVLSLFAVGAAWNSRPRSLVICFLISFAPVGFYLLLTPGIFAMIGVAQLGFLFSAVLLARSLRP